MSQSVNTECEPDANPETPSRTLAELEHIVEKGKATFIEVGEALVEIRDNKLYREQGFTSFEEYLAQRWQISRAQGYRLIAAAKVAEMSPIGDIPESEYQARQRRVVKLAVKRRAATIKTKKDLRAAAVTKPVSKLIFDLDSEFENFKGTVDRWGQVLSKEDYAQLVARAIDHLQTFKSETEVAA